MQYLFTERAHLMCPNMNFAVAMSMKRPYDPARIQKSLEVLSLAHPFLRAVFGYEADTNSYFYRVGETSKIELIRKEEELNDLYSPAVIEAFQEVTNREWNLFEEGMLKIIVWPMKEETGVLLVFHHLLADGRGALGLAEELALVYGNQTVPDYAEEELISSVRQFPENASLFWLSRALVKMANRSWQKENHRVTYEQYLSFAGEYRKRERIRYSLKQIGEDELALLYQRCQNLGVTVNDALVAEMMKTEQTGKVIIASDLRDQLACYHAGALGNYSTAFSVEVPFRQSRADLARRIHREVETIRNDPARLYLVLQCYAELEPGLLDAAFLSAQGGFSSKAGEFIGTRFFGFASPRGHSVTNLGKAECKAIDQAYFIPPSSPAMKKTWGVLTMNGVMTICTSER
ncbi:MAG: hypothetical protein IKD66_03470 [Solobacterium sp.]|nr:hypothetical protein [Solobacterium sp.]